MEYLLIKVYTFRISLEKYFFMGVLSIGTLSYKWGRDVIQTLYSNYTTYSFVHLPQQSELVNCSIFN